MCLNQALGSFIQPIPQKCALLEILYKKTVFANLLVYRPNQQPDFGQIHTNHEFWVKVVKQKQFFKNKFYFCQKN